MNVPISARDARRNKKAAMASSSAAAPSGPSQDPEVKVTRERLQADIPVVDVEAVPTETGDVQGNQAPGWVCSGHDGLAGRQLGLGRDGNKKRK